MLEYTVHLALAANHLIRVELKIEKPKAQQKITMSRWVPGSYTMREFAKNIVSIKARQLESQENVKCLRVDDSTWELAPDDNSALIVEYELYAFDYSVRSIYFDDQRAFMDGAAVFLQVVGLEDKACVVHFKAPPSFPAWHLATSMPSKNKAVTGFGEYSAQGFYDLIDHPIEIGEFQHERFEVEGIEHHLVVSGSHNGDLKMLCNDLKKICLYQRGIFKEVGFDSYWFLLQLGPNAYGGLEHSSSTALMCFSDSMPTKNKSHDSKKYHQLLGLCSHEYFHSWNVKRIKPSCFIKPDLQNKVFTRQLWAYEGITSYYDDLSLVRSQCISKNRYLDILTTAINNYLKSPGRHSQTITDSSFDAWTKFYIRNENSTNSIVSYYGKGALIALCVDIMLLEMSEGKISLNDVMHDLYHQIGKSNKGTNEGEIAQRIAQIGGLNIEEFIFKALYTTETLPLEEIFAKVGVTLDCVYPEDLLQSDDFQVEHGGELGVELQSINNELKVSSVYRDSPGALAGLWGGDVIVAIDRFKAISHYKSVLARKVKGDTVDLHVLRRDELREITVTLGPREKSKVKLSFNAKPNMTEHALRHRWLDSEDEEEKIHTEN